MAGWDKRSGELIGTIVDSSEYQRMFNYVFSDQSKKATTYKFAFIKAILDSIYSLEPKENVYCLRLNDIFDKFSENYWNLIVKYGLKQHRKSLTTSKIEDLLQPYSDDYEEIEYCSLSETDHLNIVREVKNVCKKYVIGALYEDFEGKLYGFDLKKDDYLELKKEAVFFMREHKSEIEKLNYYAWAKFLEKVNENEAQLINKLEISSLKYLLRKGKTFLFIGNY